MNFPSFSCLHTNFKQRLKKTNFSSHCAEGLIPAFRQRIYWLIDGETDDTPPQSRFLLFLQRFPALERDGALQFAGEGKPRLQRCVIRPKVSVPVSVPWRNLNCEYGLMSINTSPPKTDFVAKQMVRENHYFSWIG